MDPTTAPKNCNSVFSLFSKSNSTVIYPCQDQHVRRVHNTSRRSVWRLLSFPVVCAAENPSATDRIEQAQKLQTGKSVSFISEMEVQEYLMKETGTDRLRKMFAKDHIGQRSPEIHFISQVTLQAAAVTFLVTSFISGRHAKEDFVRENQATIFKTRFTAFRSLQDNIFLRSLKDGSKWAFKVSLFSVSLLGISQCIAVYRNKSSPWEYVAGFGVTGALMKVGLGPKGMFAGGVFGAAMGLVAGLVIWGSMYGLNETQEQRHYWQIQKLLEVEKASKGKAVSPVTGKTIQPQPVM